ncbi:OmpA family protein [Leekyejoonella antrihumi]|uniref:OmpA family protein n=1 Tax=Leekyejoonella antrihumi TaxID=1660198 RepID=UPI001648170C
MTGYTDIGNDWSLSKSLSIRRAEAVSKWLTGHSVQGSRLNTNGAGWAHAVYPTPATNAEHSANRRVTVTIRTS